MSKFKVGDRVSAEWETHDAKIRKIKGVFKGINTNGFAEVDSDGLFFCLPMTLRKLKRKERRRVWICWNKGNPSPGDPNFSGNAYAVRQIETERCGFHQAEFIEVRK